MFTQRGRRFNFANKRDKNRTSRDINYYPGSGAAGGSAPRCLLRDRLPHASQAESAVLVSIIFYNYIISMSNLD